MKHIFLFVAIVLVITSCANQQNPNAISTAVSQTLTAQPPVMIINSPTSTLEIMPSPTPTRTRRPTSTLPPPRTPTPKPTRDWVQFRIDFSTLIADALSKGIDDIEIVNMVRIANGRLEIQVKTKWASQDRQPIVSRDIIQFFAAMFVGNFSSSDAATLADSDKFSVYLVTYSTNGDYRYESTTDYETLVKVNNKTISYDEWVIASNAGFR